MGFNSAFKGLNFDSGEELGAFIGLQTVMKVNTAAVLKGK